MKIIIKILFIGLFILSVVNESEASRILTWYFPLPRTHTGILIGNGVQGLMIWGKDNQLNITIGRAGFWDHRGGYQFSTSTTYQEVKRLLEANDEAGLKKAFAYPSKKEGVPERPYQIGGGRVEIHFPAGWRLFKGELNLEKADLKIIIVSQKGEHAEIQVRQAVFEELAWIELPTSLSDRVEIRLFHSFESPKVKSQLISIGINPPEVWAAVDQKAAGFCQYLPEDDPLAICYVRDKNRIHIVTALGKKSFDIAKEKVQKVDIKKATETSDRWWQEYWESVPVVEIPDRILQQIYDYGIYKQACCTPPHGLPCSLQGPFMEEYQIPPWSNDYHFNINIQMIYWPVLMTNRLDHLKPLWEMLLNWMSRMQQNGEQFFGRKGALMLPHAVDDRCQVVGAFWTGTIDHACTAWMAQLAWLNYRYSMDQSILEQLAYPLMTGAFEGYWAMLEEIDDGKGGKRFSLPVTVSPEFKGSRMDAWGRDASFQLAALHLTVRNLKNAAEILNKPIDPRWMKVAEKLPPYTIIEAPRQKDAPERKTKRIALWEGMDLLESHRHHSYLAGIYPFCTIDPDAPEHREIIQNTLYHWVRTGAGAWSGWCVPWAAIINSRCGRTQAAISWLHFWQQNFTNVGRGTLHDADFPGISTISSPDWSFVPFGESHREIMQLDAGFGALDAVLQLLVQHRGEVIHIIPNIPRDWNHFSFKNIRTEGAFLVSAEVQNHAIIEVRVKSLVRGLLKLAHGLGDQYELNGIIQSGQFLEKDCVTGEELLLKSIK